MKKLISLLLIFALLFCVSGCKKLPDFSLSDYTKLQRYTGDPNDQLGRIPDVFPPETVFSLKDLSKDEYVCLEKFYINTPNSPPSILIYMQKDNIEPILRYDVTKIEIYEGQGYKYVTEDKQAVNALLALRRESPGEVVTEWNSNVDIMTAEFHFDLSCNLIWRCSFSYNNETGTIYFEYTDEVTGKVHCYDVTEIITNTEFIYGFEDGSGNFIAIEE